MVNPGYAYGAKKIILANKVRLMEYSVHGSKREFVETNGRRFDLLLSGAAKVDFSPESCILLRKHETLHKCSLVPIDH